MEDLLKTILPLWMAKTSVVGGRRFAQYLATEVQVLRKTPIFKNTHKKNSN